MSTPPAVLPCLSRSAEDPPLSEGLTLADLLAVLGVADDVRQPAGTAGDGDAREPRALGLRERLQGWTESAAAWGAGPQGSWRSW